jgi:hypothetical protein
MTDDRAAQREPESTEQGADLSPLEVAAIGLHEAYTAYRVAGFTDDQALTIIARMAVRRG